jgi:hypothetical protein
VCTAILIQAILTRRQVRRMIRYETIVTALIGATRGSPPVFCRALGYPPKE